MVSTAGSRSSAVTAEMPISPVGPVTATVIPTSGVLPGGAAAKPRCRKSLVAAAIFLQRSGEGPHVHGYTYGQCSALVDMRPDPQQSGSNHRAAGNEAPHGR